MAMTLLSPRATTGAVGPAQLADVYKQIEAPVGLLGTYTLQASTNALTSNSPRDRTFSPLLVLP